MNYKYKRTFTKEQLDNLIESARVAYYKRGNAITFNTQDETHLLSYRSVVCSINSNTLTITFYPDSTYSNPTAKHICQFLDKELNTRIYAKERAQALINGYITIGNCQAIVQYCEQQPKVSY